MGHSINAIILIGEYDKEEARKYELEGIELDFNLTMFFIDGFFTACWQKKLDIEGYLETNCNEVSWYPKELVIYDLMKRIRKNQKTEFALILTDYFGGAGDQFANVYSNEKNVDLGINTINKALIYLGVEKGKHHDEFDTIGLSKYRSNPDYLEKYRDLADELDV
jgi:hypothetical protein